MVKIKDDGLTIIEESKYISEQDDVVQMRRSQQASNPQYLWPKQHCIFCSDFLFYFRSSCVACFVCDSISTA